jgi:hypothetical protein
MAKNRKRTGSDNGRDSAGKYLGRNRKKQMFSVVKCATVKELKLLENDNRELTDDDIPS